MNSITVNQWYYSKSMGSDSIDLSREAANQSSLTPLISMGQCKINRIILSSILILMCGCEEEKSDWTLDSKFSEDLTISSTNYRAIHGNDSYNVVGNIRIYQFEGSDFDMYEFEELMTMPVYFEADERVIIADFFSAAQEAVMHVDTCFQNQDNKIFHVLAFSEIDARVGYFLAVLCTVSEKRYAIVHSLQRDGASSIYYSNALATVFQDMELR